jgi:hypothetical protein
MAILKNVTILRARLSAPDFNHKPAGRWYVQMVTKDLRQAGLWKNVGIPTKLVEGYFQAIITRRATCLDGSDETPVSIFSPEGLPISSRLYIEPYRLADIEYFSKRNRKGIKIAVLTGIHLI